jgi:hypothetical protein
MPSTTPAGVASRFQKQIQDLTRDFDELILAVHEKRRQASLETMIAEQTTLLVGVLWEAFVSDLLIAYVVKDPASCLKSFSERFRKSISSNDKFSGASRWITMKLPSSISHEQVERLLDPKGWNLGAASAQGLSELANQHLNAIDAKKFSLEADDRDFVDYLVSLRNYLSHRSSASRIKLASSASALKTGGVNSDLIGPTQVFSQYLKHLVRPARRRVNAIGDRVIEVSTRLV